MKFINLISVSAIFLFICNTANAHTMWINSYESGEEPRFFITLAFGHDLPLDDFLATDVGTIEINNYELIGPDDSRMDLKKPDPVPHETKKTPTGLMARTGDIGAYKFGYDDDSLRGTYQVAATSIPRYLVNYKDNKGQVRLSRKPLDEVRGAEYGVSEVMRALRYSYFSKTHLHLGDSTKTDPVGYLTEIIPETDLSKVKPGDLVKFTILFDGKPLVDHSNSQIMRATSPSFAPGSGPEAYSLSSDVYNGKAQFRIPTAGQWIVTTIIRRNVNEESALKHLREKTITDAYYLSFTFNVKP